MDVKVISQLVNMVSNIAADVTLQLRLPVLLGSVAGQQLDGALLVRVGPN